jgi:ribosomal protein L13
VDHREGREGHDEQWPLTRQIRTKLKVYAGPTHPHTAQKPEPVTA